MLYEPVIGESWAKASADTRHRPHCSADREQKHQEVPQLLVIGCGRRDSGDDAAGVLVGEALARKTRLQQRELHLTRSGGPGLFVGFPVPPQPIHVRVALTESPGVELIPAMKAIDLLIVVDAALADETHPRGSWERIDYRNFTGRLVGRRRGGSHGFSIPETLDLAQGLGELPTVVWIYAIFGTEFELGCTPAAEVVAAAVEVAGAIECDVIEFLSASTCTS